MMTRNSKGLVIVAAALAEWLPRPTERRASAEHARAWRHSGVFGRMACGFSALAMTLANLSGEFISTNAYQHGWPYTWLYRQGDPEVFDTQHQLSIWPISQWAHFNGLACAADLLIASGIIVALTCVGRTLDEMRVARQYSLRRMFVGVSLLCVLFARLAWYVDARRAEAAFRRFANWKVAQTYYDAVWLPSWISSWIDYNRFPRWLYEERLDDVRFNNHATRRHVAALRTLKRLDRVHMPAWATDDDMEVLRGLTGLTELWLDDCQITDRGFVCVGALTRLRELRLSNTAISDEGLAQLSRLTELDYLVLDHTPIRGEGLIHLGELRRLEWISLNGTQLSPGCLDALEPLKYLRVLSLEDTAVGDDDLRVVFSMKSLRYINLTNTPVTDAFVEDLHRRCPLLKASHGPRRRYGPALKEIDPSPYSPAPLSTMTDQEKK